MKKMLSTIVKLTAGAALLFALGSCDNGTTNNNDGDELSAFNGSPSYAVKWDGTFNPDYSSDGVKIEMVSDGTVAATSKGAMALNNAAGSTMVGENAGFFGSKTAVNFVDTGGAWGGLFFHLDPQLDLSSVDKIYVAVKGDLNGTKYFGLKLQSGDPDPSFEVNFLKYPASNGGDGWTIYTVPVSEFTNGGVDMSQFLGLGLWNPNLVDGTTEERDKPENYPALTDVKLCVAFE